MTIYYENKKVTGDAVREIFELLSKYGLAPWWYVNVFSVHVSPGFLVIVDNESKQSWNLMNADQEHAFQKHAEKRLD
jgi:hypothetical protein